MYVGRHIVPRVALCSESVLEISLFKIHNFTISHNVSTIVSTENMVVLQSNWEDAMASKVSLLLSEYLVSVALAI